MAQSGHLDPLAHLAAIVQSSDDAIISKDLNGIITSWNPAAERMFGYSAAEMIGKPVLAIIPEDRQQEEEYVLANVRAGRTVEHFETVRRRKDGSLIDVSLTVSPVRDSSGSLVGASKIARDITERKRLADAEHAFLVRERMVQAEANRMKDEFLATLSHELRTPLNAILGWAGLLLSGDLDEDQAQLAFRTIDRNARAQVQLVEDLLDVSRIISGKMQLDVTSVDLVEVAKAAMDVMRPAAEAKRIRLTGDWPAAQVHVKGDPDRLQQVAWNLVSNAIKFTPAGGHVRIKVEHDDAENGRLIVYDRGIGIPPNFLPHVFDRFRQNDQSLTRVHGGLGLGLAIVRHIVELHGGVVAVASSGENHGATFVVTLPSIAGVLSTTDAHAPAVPKQDRLDGIRVLAIDDQPDERELLNRVLRRHGAEVRTAANVAEALGILQRWRPDVLVSDIAMPDEDGYTLLRKVRALGKGMMGDIPAVAVTAHARAEDRERALAAGFKYYLAKPIERLKLIEAIAAAAGRTTAVEQQTAAKPTTEVRS
jgi:PAS domain S-box-containing protein